MIKKNEAPVDSSSEECTCDASTDKTIESMLCGNIGLGCGIGLVMSMMMGKLPCLDPKCNRARCQSYRWEKKDKVDAEIVFKDDKAPVLLVKLPHHRKVESLISLRAKLVEAQADLIVWKKIIEDHITEEDDKPIFEQLSDSSKVWLENSAMKALSAARAGGRSGRKVVKEVTNLDIFTKVMAGKKAYKNEAFNDKLKEICEIAINGDITEIQKEIDRITAEIPEELRGATEIPTLSIPLEKLEDLARSIQ